MDDKWKELFSLVGVTAEQMQKKETMDFIYDFVEKRGGIDNVRREIEKEKATEPRKQLIFLVFFKLMDQNELFKWEKCSKLTSEILLIYE